MSQATYERLTPRERYELLMESHAEDFIHDRYRVQLPPVSSVVNLPFDKLPYPYRCAAAYSVREGA